MFVFSSSIGSGAKVLMLLWAKSPKTGSLFCANNPRFSSQRTEIRSQKLPDNDLGKLKWFFAIFSGRGCFHSRGDSSPDRAFGWLRICFRAERLLRLRLMLNDHSELAHPPSPKATADISSRGMNPGIYTQVWLPRKNRDLSSCPQEETACAPFRRASRGGSPTGRHS